jgi:hypothetical protein
VFSFVSINLKNQIMYYSFLFIHSWLRWAVLILAVIVIVRSLSGWFGKKPFSGSDSRFSVFLVASVHLQLVLGLILYFIYSPNGYAAFQSGANVMKDSAVRYWAVEHISMMILAVVFIQVGRTLSKKAKTAIAKHKNLAIFTIIGLLLVLSRIPWDQVRMFRGL